MNQTTKRLLGVLLTTCVIGGIASFNMPVKAAVISPAISAGYYHSLALKSDGTVWGWGMGGGGQLGNGLSGSGLEHEHTTPVQVLGVGGSGNLTDVIAISAGGFHSLALKSDGTVYAWGQNYQFGQLGNGTYTNSSIPVQVLGVGGIGNLTDVIAISAGYQYSLALKSDGTVYAWGRNYYGQLGDDTTTNSTTPVQVLGVGGIGNLTDVIAISAGHEYSLALKSDGTVYAWGENYYGQLGIDTNGIGTDSSTPVQVLGVGGSGNLAGIIAISAGKDHSLALKSDGTVYAWGRNDHGQLGDNTTTRRIVPVQVKSGSGVNPLDKVISIQAKDCSSMVLKSDGTVWTWGIIQRKV
ncbi:MAG: RCC1 repeat- and reductase domain-containing protein [Dehalococcoidia bacterium]|nr:RCC1 repeat- and reductase domain-containing protein [Dehalococcoidia bacterium]